MPGVLVTEITRCTSDVKLELHFINSLPDEEGNPALRTDADILVFNVLGARFQFNGFRSSYIQDLRNWMPFHQKL